MDPAYYDTFTVVTSPAPPARPANRPVTPGRASRGYADQYAKITGQGVMSNRPLRVMAGEVVMS